MTSDSMEVRPFREADAEAWERYVLGQPSATMFHPLAWSRAVEQAYGHRPLHLTAWEGERLAGVLPLFLVKSLLVGRVLVSLPYSTYGGILADSAPAAAALFEHAKGLCEQHGARYLELRHRDAGFLDLPRFGEYDTFRKDLPERAEDVLPSLPRKTRAAARKGLDVLGEDAAIFGQEHLDTIYDLYAATLRRLGSPNYRRSFFHRLRDAFGPNCVCLLVRDGGKPVAGVVSFVFRDEIVPYFSGSLDEGMTKCANNVMYVRLMEHAIRRGLKRFDFNRTRRENHGPHAFKRYHGFEPAPLHYQMHLHKAKAMPNLTPGNRKYALAERIWRKLPVWITQPAGERISKWIP